MQSQPLFDFGHVDCALGVFINRRFECYILNSFCIWQGMGTMDTATVFTDMEADSLN